MGKIEQKDINSAAWAACDTFRGVVDPAQYKDYILVMLFLKYISDVWQAHYDDYRTQYGDNEERILRKLARERFVMPDVIMRNNTGQEIDRFPATYSSLYERRSAANIGELINAALDAIETANKGKLRDEDGGVFRNIDFNSEVNLGKAKDRNRRLKHLLEDFHKPQLDMNPNRVSEDVIGNTYIYLIERFASDAGKKAGEFYTPHCVSELVAKLAGPKPGYRICDPSCGSAGLLIEAAREVGSNDFALFGMEVNGSTWALAKMNMFIHGFDGAQIRWCNTLTSPALVENDRLMQFDTVVANPPFSLDKWGAKEAETDRYNRFWRGIPPKGKGDWAFISHMVEVARAKQGRVAVVVPHGVLFRGTAEGRIRQKMIEENLLDAVIGLPTNLFPSTSIPVAILIFDRSREKGGVKEKNTDILFIDASHDFIASKNQNTLSEDHITRIVTTYRDRKFVEKFSHLASLEEVAGNDFNLNIPRYVDTYEAEEEIDIMAVQNDIDELEKELREVRRDMEKLLREIHD
ncbi:MAG: type I restriction-modification system subunit M [Gammaproteobacteria bacterium]|nr:type I restriction-modification system subunit M [Gammaproteobacteria bacterium]MDH5651615.1 type I restriction-modification system subunit M [Gammaproteobacteria bacterium]